MWVTKFAENEKYPAGFYTNQSKGNDGIVSWTSADRNIENEDVVVYYVLGSTHIPKLEDWPVMPTEQISFLFKPCNFFEENPTLDIETKKNTASHSNKKDCH